MNDNERLISVDDHVRVSDDDIKGRLPVRLRSAYDGAVAALTAHHVKLAGGRMMSVDMTWDHEAAGRAGYSDPAARLADMDQDGVDASVLYSEISGFRLYHLVRNGWQEAARALNDTLADFASIDPKRLIVAYQVPLMDIDVAVREVERLAGLGARAVHLPNYPADLGLPDYHDEYYDRLWALLQEANIPVHHHLGNKDSSYDVYRRDPTPQWGVYNSLNQLALAENLGFWLLTGILERFPRLRVVFAEAGLSWIPFYLDTLDRRAKGPFDFPALTELPRFYFQRQVAVTFFDDALGLKLRHELGVENIMWSSDYPHPDTTWPHSREVVDRQFAGVPPDERELILSGNARRVYGL